MRRSLYTVVFVFYALGFLHAAAPDVYIPKNLDDAHESLLKTLPAETIEKIKKCSAEEMVRFHFSIGAWMRNNWGLWKGSRLSKNLNELGLRHPDDMSAVLLDSFWYRLHDKQFPLEREIKKYQDYWRSVEKNQ